MTCLTCYELTGEDRLRFLNNYLTADLQSWSQKEPIEGMLLDVKGRVIALTTVWASEESLLILSWGIPMTDVVEHLDRYIFGKGKAIRQMGGNAVYVAGQTVPSGWLPASPLVQSVLRDGRRWQLNLNMGGAVHLELCEPVPPAPIELSDGQFEDLRIRSAFPVVGQDSVEATLPQELKRDQWDISFTKGCYLGQETVARLDARGHVNWSLARLAIEKSDVAVTFPDGSDVVCDGQVVGKLTSVAGSFGLGRLRATHVGGEHELTIQHGENVLASCRAVPESEIG